MNQSVQILDGCAWDNTRQVMVIQAMVSGFILPCYIEGVDQTEMESCYQARQFDIEEHLVEQLNELDLDIEEGFCCHIEHIAGT